MTENMGGRIVTILNPRDVSDSACSTVDSRIQEQRADNEVQLECTSHPLGEMNTIPRFVSNSQFRLAVQSSYANPTASPEKATTFGIARLRLNNHIHPRVRLPGEICAEVLLLQDINKYAPS